MTLTELKDIFYYPVTKTRIEEIVNMLEHVVSSTNHIPEAVADAKHDLKLLCRLEKEEKRRRKNEIKK